MARPRQPLFEPKLAFEAPTWRIFWYEPDASGKPVRRRVSTGCALGEEALAHTKLAVFQAELKAQREAAEQGRARSGEVTVNDVLDRYLARREQQRVKHAARGEDRYASLKVMQAQVKPLRRHLGTVPVTLVDDERVDEYVEKRLDESGMLADSTLRNELVRLRAALNCAVHELKILREEDIKYFELPPDSTPRQRYLSSEEAVALLEAANQTPIAPTVKGGEVTWVDASLEEPTHVYLFVLIGLFTGARSKAILQLTWDQVRWDENVIDFNLPGARGRYKKPRAVVVMTDELRKRLLRVYTARRTAMGGQDIGRLHLITRGNKPINSIRQAFMTACERAGLNPSEDEVRREREGRKAARLKLRQKLRAGETVEVDMIEAAEDLEVVTPHTLRHTAATWAAMRGVSMREIALMLGHKSERTTESVYAKFHPSYQKGATAAIDQTFAAGLAARKERREQVVAHRKTGVRRAHLQLVG